jgi:uncharacterized protein YaaN involved in tellurite resistance
MSENNNQEVKNEEIQYAEVIETVSKSTTSTTPTSLISVDNRTGKPDMSKFSPEQIDRFKQKTAMIKTDDNTSILNFGLDVQNKLSASSTSFLNNVRAFDAGQIGNSITDLLTEINHIEIDPSSQPGWKRVLMQIPGLKKIMMSTKKMFQKYDTVNANVDGIVRKLDNGRLTIIKDNNQLQQLFNDNENHIESLEELLVVGHMKYDELQQEIVEMELNSDNYEDYEIADKKEFLNRLDKRLHDMAITRMVTIQSLPQIRLVQNNNFVMAEKIQASITTTIPIWRQQIAIAVALDRQSRIVQMQKGLADTTNEILRKNANMLKQNSIEVAKQNERAVVDIETLREVQNSLISTIQEIKQIKEQGVIARRNADKALTELEADLSKSVLEVQNTTKQLK